MNDSRIINRLLPALSLLPDTVQFLCEASGYDAEKIGLHFLEILPKIGPPEQR